MQMNAGDLPHKDRTPAIAAIGALLLVAGVAVGLLGPIEMYCFHLFSEGGRFHYEGFGFGSFMFGNIAGQIVGYYLIAALFIPLGYGHLRMRRWARPLSVALLWSWLLLGAPLSLVVSFILAASKDLSLLAAVIALVSLALSYLVLPPLLIRFYGGRNVRRTFEARDAKASRIEELPTPILVLSCLFVFYVIVLHLPILFNGIFPWFGTFRSGLQGIVLLDVSIASLICITWGMLQLRLWAWWGAVILVGLFTLSTILTLVRSSYSTILSVLAFPPRELEFLGKLPVQGYHFAVLIGTPLVLTWGLAALSKRYFRTGR